MGIQSRAFGSGCPGKRAETKAVGVGLHVREPIPEQGSRWTGPTGEEKPEEALPARPKHPRTRHKSCTT